MERSLSAKKFLILLSLLIHSSVEQQAVNAEIQKESFIITNIEKEIYINSYIQQIPLS